MARRPLVGQGSNSVQLRRYNARIVLQVLRRVGIASKADLARLAQLTNAAIGAIIQDLTAAGLITSLGKRRHGGRGQPATMLTLSPTGAYGFGVRLDRTAIETVLADFSGAIIGRRSHDMLLPEPEVAVELVRRDIDALLPLVPPQERARIAGIGVAMPFNLGAWLHELGLPAGVFHLWDTVDVRALLEAATDFPVFVENDGTAATIAELFSGAGRGADDFLYFFLGPAIGGGLVMGGDCQKGVTGNAGDVAMMPVPPSTLASAPRPGKPLDILLTRASLAALRRHLTHCGVDKAGSRDALERIVAARHPAAEEWLADCIAALTPAISAATALLDIPLVVIDFDIDGGLADRIVSGLAEALAAAAPEARVAPRVARGSFGRDAGAIGAACLPMFVNYSPRAAILTGAEASPGHPGVTPQEAGTPQVARIAPG